MGICNYEAQKTFEINFDDINLKCPLCENKYSENLVIPKNLPCGHTICKDCILKMKMKTNENSNILKCPFDRNEYAYNEFPTSNNILKTLGSLKIKSESRLQLIKRYNTYENDNNYNFVITEENLIINMSSNKKPKLVIKEMNGIEDISAIEKSYNLNKSDYSDIKDIVDYNKDIKINNEISFSYY